MLAVRERLHLRQVRVLLERQRHGDHDGLVQQLLPDVRLDDEARGDAGGQSGDREAQNRVEATQSVHGWQTQKGRNQCGLFRLQQKDPAHCLASHGEHHRRCCNQ